MRVAVWLLALLLASPAGAEARFSWLELLPGVAEQSEAAGISANGCVVVGTVGHWESGDEAVRWVGGAVERIEPVAPGMPFRIPVSASADGSVVAGGFGSVGRGFVNDQGISAEVLPPAGYDVASGRAVSDDGSALVGLAHGNERTLAFRYRQGSFTALPLTPRAVSADGSVVVGSAGARAARWQDGTSTELGLLPGATSSEASALTPDGSVVVGTSGSSGFRWRAGVMTPIGTGITPLDVSADGETVVGYVDLIPSGRSSRIWTPSEGARRLSLVLGEWGLDVSGLQLTEAIGISDDALAIVGKGLDPQGRERAWLATREDRDCSPPNPPQEPGPPAPLPAKEALLYVGDLPAPLVWMEPHGLAVAPDGVVYLAGSFAFAEGPDAWRSTEAILEISPGGAVRTLAEMAPFELDPFAADRESVVWSQGARIVRIDRRDGQVLLEVDLNGFGAATAYVDSVALDPDANVYATTEGTGPDGRWDCFGVTVVTRHGYVKRLTDPAGDPCFLPEPAVSEWQLGALHVWSVAALRRLEVDRTLTTLVSVADGLESVGYHDFDATGNLYVSEFLGDSVWKIRPDGERTRIIDRDGDLVGHPLEWANNVRVDHRGHVFVASGIYPWVFEIFPNGAIRRILDETGDGEVPAGFSVDRLELDTTGNLYALLTDDVLFGIPPSTEIPEPAEPDRDGDGLVDVADNCRFYPNADQRDVDGDSYGSACDPDFNNDGVVGAPDLIQLGQAFGSVLGDARYHPTLDMNDDLAIGTHEFLLLVRAFGGPPGLLRP